MAKTKAVKAEPKEPERGFLTDKQIRDLGVDPFVGPEVFDDAQTVYDRISRTPHTTMNELVKWWTGTRGLGVDRLNAALALLRRVGRVFEV